jgi:histidinol phosphatase-like enzyme
MKLKYRRSNVNNRITVFLDLQGTLGGDGLGDTSNFEFYPFTIEAIKRLRIPEDLNRLSGRI